MIGLKKTLQYLARAACLWAALAVAPSPAQVPGTFIPPLIAGPTIISATRVSGGNSSTTATSFTFSTMSLGAAPTAGEKRYIIVAASLPGLAVDNPQPPTITAGGVTLTSNIDARDLADPNRPRAVIYSGEVPTGTTGDVVLTETSGPPRNWQNASVDVYRVIVVEGTLSLYDSASNGGSGAPSTTAVDIAANGFAVGVISTLRDGTGSENTSATWATLTEDSDAVIEAGNSSLQSAASVLATTAQTAPTITATIANSNGGGRVMVISSYRAITL